jgi:hypothetical protein
MNITDSVLLADALEEHDYSDWYSAILHTALEETKGEVRKAIEVANAVYKENPEDTSSPSEDDAQKVFGKILEKMDDPVRNAAKAREEYEKYRSILREE